MGKHYTKETGAPVQFKGKSTKRRRLTAIALALCVTAAAGAGSFATVLAEDAPVISSVIDGDKHYSVSIPSTDVDRLLYEAGIVLNDEDVVVREENANGTTVTVKRKLMAEISVGGKKVVAEGYTGDTVGQLIENAGVELGSLDAVTPSVQTQVWEDTDVEITEMKSIYIVDNNVARNYVVPAGSVADAAAFAGVELGSEDTLSNSKQDVEDGMIISVDRVTYETVEKTETVEFTVEEKETSELYVGETEVETEGKDGEKLVTYEQKLVNGEVVKTTKVGEEITKKAQNKVVLVGTKEKRKPVQNQSKPQGGNSQSNGTVSSAGGNKLVDSNGNVINYKSVMTGTCTAYSGDSTTSTGMKPQVGVVAVNPNQIPYGTRLYIASPDGSYVYGYAVAGDTGGAMMAGHAMVDLYMNTEKECYDFGRRTMCIYVLS